MFVLLCRRIPFQFRQNMREFRPCNRILTFTGGENINQHPSTSLTGQPCLFEQPNDVLRELGRRLKRKWRSSWNICKKFEESARRLWSPPPISLSMPRALTSFVCHFGRCCRRLQLGKGQFRGVHLPEHERKTEHIHFVIVATTLREHFRCHPTQIL